MGFDRNHKQVVAYRIQSCGPLLLDSTFESKLVLISGYKNLVIDLGAYGVQSWNVLKLVD